MPGREFSQSMAGLILKYLSKHLDWDLPSIERLLGEEHEGDPLQPSMEAGVSSALRCSASNPACMNFVVGFG